MFVRTLAAASAVAVAATILAGCGTASGPGLALPQYQSAQSAARDSSFQSLRQLPDRIAPPKAKMLYLADRNAAAIIGFPANANGNVAPSVAIKGEATGLTNPVALTVDTAGRLLAINDSGNEVLIFPKGASGDAAPQVLGGSHVPQFESEGVAVDHSGQIYVSSYSTDAILVFKKGAHGNVAPIRTISGANTQLAGPVDMAFDSQNDLYVANAYAPGSSPAFVEEFAPDATETCCRSTSCTAVTPGSRASTA